MADNLTKNIQAILKERGTAASLTQVQDALDKLSSPLKNQPKGFTAGNSNVVTPEQVSNVSSGEQWAQSYQPDPLNVEPSALNAVGAALWSFADSASFGAAGALIDEEKYIDFDDPMAKWTSAIGGFAGFIGGAPLKTGMKISQMLAKAATKGTGKKHVDEVVGEMVKRGRAKGLGDDTIDEITTGYKSIVNQAQYNNQLRGGEFIKKSEDFLSQYLSRAEQVGELTAREVVAAKKMFGPALKNRPIQDWYGVMTERGIFANNPRAAKTLSHIINDAVMLSVVDTTFEGMTMFEDGNFDWTQPMWGAATGLGFGALGWLMPRGAAASWKKDMVHGIKAAFGKKDLYRNMSAKQIEASAQFWGESLKRTEALKGQPVSHLVDISYKGQKAIGIDLTHGDVLGQLRSTFGKDAQFALKEFMESTKGKMGKELMRFATKEAAGNLAEVWPRMIAGGALFNLHSFYEMARNGAELGVNDILPHFLIGAWIQRHANPAKFDMSPKGVNQLRGNLMRLGVGPGQFNEIPTLKYRDSALNSPFNSTEWSPIVDTARDLGIISSTPEIVETNLKAGEQSVAMQENRIPKFEIVYEKLINHGEESMYKPIEQISVKEAKQIMEEVYKINPDLRKADTEELLKAFDKSTLSATKDFEQDFVDVVESVRRIDENIDNELEITSYNDKSSPGRIPARVNVSNSIKQAAKKGVLKDDKGNPLLVDSDGNVLEGQDALDALNRKIASFNSVLTTVDLIGAREKNPNTDLQTKQIESSELLAGVFKTIKNAEDTIQQRYPDNRHMQEQFSFFGSFNDYIHILSRNVAIRSADSVSKIFEAGAPSNVRSGLISQLISTDLLLQGPTESEPVLRKDVRNIKFDEESFSNADMDISEARRLLGRVLTIQAASGGYKLASEGTKSSKQVGVKYEDVQKLQHFLSDQGFQLKSSLKNDWMHNQIVDYIVGQRVQDSRLSLDQTDALFELADRGLANFEAAVEGKAAGFSIKKIDLDVLNNDSVEYRRAKEYNDWVDRLISDGKRRANDSEGLVSLETGKYVSTDNAFMQMIDGIIHKSPGKYVDATQAITQFIAALPSDGKSYETLRKNIEIFINGSPANAARLSKWLVAAKVISKPGVGAGNWKLNKSWLKKAQEISDELTINMEKFGYDANYSKETYQEIEDATTEKLLDDVYERDKSKPITLQKFWSKYRFGHKDNDVSQLSSKEMADEFQKLIYNNYADVNKDGAIGLLHKDIFTRFTNNVYIEDSFGKWTKLALTNQKSLVAGKLTNALKDYAYLVGSQHRQKPVTEISFNRGNLKVESKVHQRTGFDVLMNAMGMTYYRINPMAPITESVGGRYTRLRHVDLFSGKSQNVDKTAGGYADTVNSQLSVFQGLMKGVMKLPNGDSLASKEGGLEVMRIGNGTDVIAIERGQFKKLFEPFKKLYDEYKDNPEISKETKVWKTLIDKIDRIESDGKDTVINPAEAEYMLHRLTHKEMLTGTEKVGGFKDSMFIDFLNGKNQDKISGRIKLMHTKKFTRFDKDFVENLAQIYEAVERFEHDYNRDTVGGIAAEAGRQRSSKRAATALKRVADNDGFGVLVWNDEGYNTVRDDTESIIRRELGANYKDWTWDEMQGKAHQDTSAFDSIAFVNESTMIAAHALMGHNHNSRNPIKPVISSHGEGKPLLLGKTLLVYTRELDSFFRSNPEADILLSKSGAKVMNSNEKIQKDGSVKDLSMINRSWNYISGKDKTTRYYGQGNGRLRKISIDALGLQPQSDTPFKTSPESLSNFNYADNAESGEIFRNQYERYLDYNLDAMQSIAQDPIAMRKFILAEAAKDGLAPNMNGENQSLRELNNIVHFATYSRDANPLSYSDNIAKNKLYAMYINSLVNGKRSVSNQYDGGEGSDRYGGQSIIIQSARGADRLRPTIVKKDGDIAMRGQVMLSQYEARMRLGELAKDGFELRFVEDLGKDYKTIDDIVEYQRQVFEDVGYIVRGKGTRKFDSEFSKEEMQNWTLGEMHEFIQFTNSVLGKDTEIGVIVNRKPRTRPNDMTVLGLKGFLHRDYGNSIQLASLDVVNIFEGDYDVDKADYFFAHQKEMWNHVHRTQQHFINGVDPDSYKIPSEGNVGLTPVNDRDKRWESYADNEQFTKNIGTVQKVPRALSALDNLADTIPNEQLGLYGLEPFYGAESKRKTKTIQDGKLVSSEGAPAKVLLNNPNDNSSITIDYQNVDFFMRSALETQYIIDGSGKLNSEIASNLRRWKDDFLFPSIDNSIAGGESIRDNGGMGFIDNIKHKKNSKRVRVFRKFKTNSKGEKQEVDLTNIEKAVIKEMLSQYNSLLNATGKTMWENSGDQRPPRFTDVMSAAKKYSGFMNDISNSIYYNLRHRRIDPENPDSKKWMDDSDFNDYFGVETKSYDKWDKGKKYKKKYWKPSRDIFKDLMGQNRIDNNAKQMAMGERGSVVDRIMTQFARRDPFEETTVRSIGGAKEKLMDSWYQQLRTGTDKDVSEATDRFQHEIKEGKWSHQKKVKLIGNLKKKIIDIQNSKLPHVKRKVAIDKVNKFIKELESEIPDALIPEKYKKTKKYKDLKDGIIGFKWIGEDDIKDGTIQYSAIDNLQRILPYGKTLGAPAREFLKEILYMRKQFFSNQDTFKDILEYGDRTILDSESIEYLRTTPDLTTFYEVEHKLLMKGLNEYGFNFVLEYMKPTEDRKNIGVHNGRLIDIPYAKSNRYKRGLQFLTRVAETRPNDDSMVDFLKPENEGGFGPDAQDIVRQNLRNLQTMESQFERFFNDRFDRINLIGDNLVDDPMDVTVRGGVRNLRIEDVRLPDLNKDMSRGLTSFSRIKWSRDKSRISDGFNIMNDHLIDLYRNIAIISGQEQQFREYLDDMTDINSQLMSNRIIHPMDYLADRASLDDKMRNLAQRVLTNPELMGQNNQNVKNIKDNPVYALMGGGKYYNSMSLEKTSTLSHERLRSMQQMFDNLSQVRDNVGYRSNKTKREFIDERIRKYDEGEC